MCVAVAPCLACYSGKEAPCVLHRVTAIATLHIFWQQCRRVRRRQMYWPFGNHDLGQQQYKITLADESAAKELLA